MAKEKKQASGKTSLDIGADKLKSIKYICLMTEQNQTEVLNEAVAEYITKFEKKHGPIPKM